MADLQVTNEHPTTLADQLDDVSKAITNANGETSGIVKSVWVSHGVVCGACNVGVATAQSGRNAASAAMKAVVDDLANKLRVAESRYAGTDSGSGKNLDKQILPG
jgi:Excreted virulence factor EspC, type VII ESX diderm